jgi:histidinol phosphatase-like PHP family hydrolase
MIGLHTHSILSDGALLPSELVRRAWQKGYKAIAITDHVDYSNIDFVVPRLVDVCKRLTNDWPIQVIPGVELTHIPLNQIKPLVNFARKNHAQIIVGHGETVSEPVLEGTNREFIKNKIDILAHPGMIDEDDAFLAKKNGVYLEITSRKSHNKTNKHVYNVAKKAGANLVINTDAHEPEDLITELQAIRILRNLGMNQKEADATLRNAGKIARTCRF